MRRILVTGATGLVGFEVYDRLRRTAGVAVTGVSRRGSDRLPAVVPWHIGAQPPPVAVGGPWDVIVNAAADVRWSLDPDEARAANVDTVAALRPLASPRTRVIHVSTAYAGGRRGDGSSPDLADYRNSYEWSKAHAERLAREAFARLTVIRPALIVGRRGDGRAARFTGMYTLLRGIATGTVPVIAADPQARLDLVPVDAVAGLILAATADDAHDGAVWTIAGGRSAPTVAHVLDLMMAALNGWRAAGGHDPVPTPRIVPAERWHRFFRPFAREHLTVRQNRMLDLLSVFEPYLAGTVPLSPTHTVADVGACLRTAVSYWAAANPRLAAMTPLPWRGRTAA
ncbi:sugar nucleotide-binding protein [Planosporangium thailandense]|uniref:Sugar nucleotide-binding protein n=1 Tax=Planosporangium thailandense TaxID=765197 RepID=A0ABX0Y6K8_9ACTN|nr:SDR family oxidoreductase [Planosporangium thailandense]NJC74040.1 sugar nucleotide-binding protein [Planosporangium thailandense]